jgi:hypothetical protein
MERQRAHDLNNEPKQCQNCGAKATVIDDEDGLCDDCWDECHEIRTRMILRRRQDERMARIIEEDRERGLKPL